MGEYKDYIDPSTCMDYWVNEISPKYFDFDTAELHRSGVFGYVNEVMATTENDSVRGIATARREFYPTTAQYVKSFYKMGALQQISYPLATPCTATATLLLKEADIIKYATETNGIYKFVIDNTLQIMAGDIEFRLDYPIIILAKKKRVGTSVLSNTDTGDDGNSKYMYTYTIRYDISYTNSLNTNNIKYIKNRTVTYANEVLLLLKVGVHQVHVDNYEQTVNTSPTLNNVIMDFPFDGQLCNFEVFYQESNSTTRFQLTKLPKNSNPINTKFCMYSLVDDHTIRLEFPSNAYFAPKFNSKIDIDIYTTLGSAGQFPVFNVDLICTPNSEKYPYNNTVPILGQILGSSIGGADFPELEDFKNDVIAAYATNKVYTTEQDLQIYFDSKNKDKRNKILFFKRRDDVFERLYGAFMLIKDQYGNVIPTNSLTMELLTSELNLPKNSSSYVIKPGRVWKYQDNEHYYSDKCHLYSSDYDLNTDINDNIEEFVYVNPFLIKVSTTANAIGYYLNTVNTTIPMDTKSINDASLVQFNINAFTCKRNAICGENFYKLTIYLQPSITVSDLSTMLFTPPETLALTDGDTWPLEIRAQFDGIIEKYEYTNGSVYMIVRYEPNLYNDNGERVVVKRENLVKYMEEANYFFSEDDLRIMIRVSSSFETYKTEEGQTQFRINSWYHSDLKPGDRFSAGSIIARRKLQDTGILRVIGQLSDSGRLFIPFMIEDYDPSGDVYTLSAYLSTNDAINDNGRLEIAGGFFNQNGESNPYVSINPTNCVMSISTFIQYDDINDTNHAYSEYKYVEGHTFTNTYYSFDQTFDFIKPFKFIRSTLTFNRFSSIYDDDVTYYLRISEVPVVRANWMRSEGNVEDLISILNSNYEFLLETYDLLENNYSIDLKFFNTYGKSRFYRIGIRDDLRTLSRLNIVPKFGIKLSALTSYEEFRGRFVNFVRDWIESFNDVNNTGKSIYLMDLVTAIKNNFEEIERIEYYGIDDESADNAQNIVSFTKEEIMALGYNKYVPEFINVYCDYVDCELTPQIDITLLE